MLTGSGVSLDFLDLEKPSIIGAIRDEECVQDLFDAAEHAVRYVHRAVVSDAGLRCDDLRFAPPIDAIRLLVFLLLLLLAIVVVIIVLRRKKDDFDFEDEDEDEDDMGWDDEDEDEDEEDFEEEDDFEDEE